MEKMDNISEGLYIQHTQYLLHSESKTDHRYSWHIIDSSS